MTVERSSTSVMSRPGDRLRHRRRDRDVVGRARPGRHPPTGVDVGSAAVAVLASAGDSCARRRGPRRRRRRGRLVACEPVSATARRPVRPGRPVARAAEQPRDADHQQHRDAEHHQPADPVDAGGEPSARQSGHVGHASQRSRTSGRLPGATPMRAPACSRARSTIAGCPSSTRRSCEWYDEHARDLPWRRTTATAWAVLVSEFMLQQTPVARVLPVYEAWMERWPTPAVPGRRAGRRGDPCLGPARLPAPGAAAARGRHGDRRAARRRGPATPTTRCARCPGVGDYTASAVLAFAFGRRHAVLDTNVRRVLARVVTGVEFPPNAVTAAERAVAADAAARRRADGRDLVGRADGARRPGLHRRLTRLRDLPGARPVRLAARRPPGVRRAAAARAGLGGHRPPVPRPADGAGSRRRGLRPGPGDGAGLAGAGAAATRCLAGSWPTACWCRAATATRCRPSRPASPTARRPRRRGRRPSAAAGRRESSGWSSWRPMKAASTRFAAWRAAAALQPDADEVVGERTHPDRVRLAHLGRVGLVAEQPERRRLDVEALAGRPAGPRSWPRQRSRTAERRSRDGGQRTDAQHGAGVGGPQDRRDQVVLVAEVVEQHPVAGAERLGERPQAEPDQPVLEA